MANGVIGKVTAGGGTHLVTSTFYGTCTTAAGTAAKIVKLADATPDSATLITGMLLAVKFTNGNTVANPTLTIQRNANTTNLIAAKSIMAYGSTKAGNASGTAWRAGAVILFIYDGTNWVITDYNEYSIHQNAAITTNGSFNLLGGLSANANEETGSVNKLSGLTYNPSTHNLITTASGTNGAEIKAVNDNGTVSILASTNRGLYDRTKSTWIIYNNTAGDHTYAPLWASKGSSSEAVYFNTNGEPVKIATADLKAGKDGDGNIITSTYATVNHTHSRLEIGKDTDARHGSLDHITRPLVGSAASNKTFNLPAEAITVEYSTDGGNTWTDYGATNAEKVALFSETKGKNFYLGKASAKANNNINNQLRVTIEPTDRYTSMDSVYVWLSDSANTVKMDLECSTIAAKETFVTIFTNQLLDGWPNNNIRYFPQAHFGGTTNQTDHYYKYRLTFKQTAINANYGSAYVSDIRFYGMSAWTAPNNMVEKNHIYDWDVELNTTFPAKLITNGTITAGGSIIAGSESADSEKDVIARTLAGSIYLWSASSATGDKGIYAKNHDGTGKSILKIDQNNDVTLYGNLDWSYIQNKPTILTLGTTSTTAAAGNHTHDYLPLSGGIVTGTLILSRTQDASGTVDRRPALIVGGQPTSTHLEFDSNEIQAKTDGTSTATLCINNDGGDVYFGPTTKATGSTTAGVRTASGFAVAKNIWLGRDADAATTTNKSSQLIISSSDSGAGEAVALELWRGTNASWQIANSGGNLYLRSNWNSTLQTTYSVNALILNHTTGNATFKGTVTAPTFTGNLIGNAEKDGDGNVITSTYATKTELGNNLPLIRGTGTNSMYLDRNSEPGIDIPTEVTGNYSIAFGNGYISGRNSLILSGSTGYIEGSHNLVLTSGTTPITLTGAANATIYTVENWPTSSYPGLEAWIGKKVINRTTHTFCATITNVDTSGAYPKITTDTTLSSAALSSSKNFAIAGATILGDFNIGGIMANITGGQYNVCFGNGGPSATNGWGNFLYGSFLNNTNNKDDVVMFGANLKNVNTKRTFIIGQSNEPDTTDKPHSFVIGGGGIAARKNIFSVDKTGNVDKVNDITLADNATLHYNSTTESLDFIFA